jgi:hypothetical protein
MRLVGVFFFLLFFSYNLDGRRGRNKNERIFSFIKEFYCFLALNNHSMCQIGTSEEKMSPNDDNHQRIEEFSTQNNEIKYLVDLYTAALHLR